MDIRNLIDRCREGDEAAERDLVCYYISRVAMVAERRISPAYLRRFDGDDVANSVMKSLMLRIRRGALDSEDEWQMWCLLLKMTKRKVSRRVREARQGKRDILREAHPNPSDGISGIDLAEMLEDSSDTTYEDSAELLESALAHLESTKKDLKGPSHRAVIELCKRGMAYKEICEVLAKEYGNSFSLKFIQRRIADVKNAVATLNADTDEE